MQAASTNSTVADNWTIPRPSHEEESLYQNVNRNSIPFFQAAGIKEDSTEKKDLKITIQALHSKYLHPYKYLEEQPADKVNWLIQQATTELPWLMKYEDSWPARIYLKRYVDTRRPHLGCSRHAKENRILRQRKPQTTEKELCPSGRTCTRRNLANVPKDDTTGVREFLCSLQPSLEHHLDAFVELGFKDEEALQAFLSWPDDVQAHFIDEGTGILKITNVERTGLLVGCRFVKQKVLQGSLTRVANARYYD